MCVVWTLKREVSVCDGYTLVFVIEGKIDSVDAALLNVASVTDWHIAITLYSYQYSESTLKLTVLDLLFKNCHRTGQISLKMSPANISNCHHKYK